MDIRMPHFYSVRARAGVTSLGLTSKSGINDVFPGIHKVQYGTTVQPLEL